MCLCTRDQTTGTACALGTTAVVEHMLDPLAGHRRIRQGAAWRHVAATTAPLLVHLQGSPLNFLCGYASRKRAAEEIKRRYESAARHLCKARFLVANTVFVVRHDSGWAARHPCKRPWNQVKLTSDRRLIGCGSIRDYHNAVRPGLTSAMSRIAGHAPRCEGHKPTIRLVLKATYRQ